MSIDISMWPWKQKLVNDVHSNSNCSIDSSILKMYIYNIYVSQIHLRHSFSLPVSYILINITTTLYFLGSMWSIGKNTSPGKRFRGISLCQSTTFDPNHHFSFCYFFIIFYFFIFVFQFPMTMKQNNSEQYQHYWLPIVLISKWLLCCVHDNDHLKRSLLRLK